MNAPICIVRQPCRSALDWVSQRIRAAGMQMVCTFDLQVARRSQPGCPCPTHGAAPCDCQMVILLVYNDSRHPLTLVAYGQDSQTWLSLADGPQQRTETRLEEAVQRALGAQTLAIV